MFKQILCLLMAAFLVQVTSTPAVAAGGKGAGEEAKAVEKVKAGIAKLGTGPEVRVEVKLRDKSKLKGYVSEATDEHFTVVDADGKSIQVAYPQVRQVKGKNHLTGKQIAVTAVVVALFVIPLLIWASSKGT